jgi:hypothetical protein
MPSLPVLSFVTLALVVHHGSAGATMVKCRGDQGSVIYQDAACKPGAELRNFDTDPATVSVVPFPRAVAPAPRAAPPRERASQSPRHPPAPSMTSGRAAERRFIRTGMSESEVVRRIGKPEADASTSRNKRKDGKRWSYLPAEGDPQTITTITIVAGQVTDVERKIVR